jgi:hypothetical protein
MFALLPKAMFVDRRDDVKNEIAPTRRRSIATDRYEKLLEAVY